MSILFNMTRDINGYNGFGLKFSTDKFDVTLAMGTPQQITIPGNFERWLAIFNFNPGASVWVARNTVAVVPGGTIGSTNSDLNPAGREVFAGDTISFITSDTTAFAWVALYALQ